MTISIKDVDPSLSGAIMNDANGNIYIGYDNRYFTFSIERDNKLTLYEVRNTERFKRNKTVSSKKIICVNKGRILKDKIISLIDEHPEENFLPEDDLVEIDSSEYDSDISNHKDRFKFYGSCPKNCPFRLPTASYDTYLIDGQDVSNVTFISKLKGNGYRMTIYSSGLIKFNIIGRCIANYRLTLDKQDITLEKA